MGVIQNIYISYSELYRSYVKVPKRTRSVDYLEKKFTHTIGYYSYFTLYLMFYNICSL